MPNNPLARKRKRSQRKTLAGRGRTARPGPWVGVLAAAVVLLVVGIGALKWAETRAGRAALLGLGSERMHDDVQAAVEEALAGVLPQLAPGPAHEDRPGDRDRPAPEIGAGVVVRCRTLAVDHDRSWWSVQEEIARALAPVGARVIWGERLPTSRRGPDGRHPNEMLDVLRLDVGVVGHPTHTLILHRADRHPRVRWDGHANADAWDRLRAGEGPVVALIIDDWGYGRNATTRRLLDLPVPLTMAVLPGQSYSRHFALQATDLLLPPTADAGPGTDAARIVRRSVGAVVEVAVTAGRAPTTTRRREIMLHLPMQPQSWPDTDPGPDAIMVGMGRDDIVDRLDEALAGLPHARGVNNHMGSAATSDAPTMGALMAELRERGLYFVDSLTSSRSVAWDEARKAGLPTARNRLFLDYDNEDQERIAANLARLVEAARGTGFALGIAHPHRATAEVLARELPRLAAEGVRFVTVSEFLALRGSGEDGT